ncbi:MAG: outer membrane protein transport protein [Betaproteobacteria bacterium]|nr:outer membrane protein transport protein [Betaproteobacteria bacterium]
MQGLTKRVAVAASLAACSLLCAGRATAAAFFLPYQGAAGIGNSLAGAAALGEDASTVFFNPAGMSRIGTGQVSLGAHFIDPGFKYTDTGSTGPAAFTGGNGGSFVPASLLPTVFAVLPMGNWRFGLGISAPWGSKTDYDEGWRGRFQADYTDVKTINVNPSVAYRFSDRISAGFGLNYLHADAEIKRSQLLPGPSEGRVTLTGKDSALGFNAGVLVEFSEATRVGVSYRSRVDLNLEGRQTVTLANGTVFAAQTFDITADLTLPAISQVSVVHALNDRWTVLGDLAYYQWSSIQSLVPRNAATGAASSPLDLNFKDSKRLSAALNYRLNDAWLLRAGLAWDQTPVKDAANRTANQPDSDRTWVSLGARWDPVARHRVDLAYAYVMLAASTIDHTVASAGTLRGEYDNSAHILAAQYTFSW